MRAAANQGRASKKKDLSTTSLSENKVKNFYINRDLWISCLPSRD
jgi:hypothetical protein